MTRPRAPARIVQLLPCRCGRSLVDDKINLGPIDPKTPLVSPTAAELASQWAVAGKVNPRASDPVIVSQGTMPSQRIDVFGVLLLLGLGGASPNMRSP